MPTSGDVNADASEISEVGEGEEPDSDNVIDQSICHECNEEFTEEEDDDVLECDICLKTYVAICFFRIIFLSNVYTGLGLLNPHLFLLYLLLVCSLSPSL